MLAQFPSITEQRDLDNFTIFEILAQSDETTELFKYLQQESELTAALSDAESEYTIWAPHNKAFSLLKSTLGNDLRNTWKSILQYHISPHSLPSSRLQQMGCVPTLLRPSSMNGDLRLRLRPTTAGMQLNFDISTIKSDIIARNGVIHIINAVLLPPPSMMRAIDLLPNDFSIAQHVVRKSGLASDLDIVKGGTMFIPSNAAFEKLGGEANKFLLETEEGEQYMNLILQLHFSREQTLYSNAFYKPTSNNDPGLPKPAEVPTSTKIERDGKDQNQMYRLRKGTRSFNLSTALPGRDLRVNISRYGSIIAMFVNRWSPVSTQDYLASNGVIHLLDSVLLPSDEKPPVDLKPEILKMMFTDISKENASERDNK